MFFSIWVVIVFLLLCISWLINRVNNVEYERDLDRKRLIYVEGKVGGLPRKDRTDV